MLYCATVVSYAFYHQSRRYVSSRGSIWGFPVFSWSTYGKEFLWLGFFLFWASGNQPQLYSFLHSSVVVLIISQGYQRPVSREISDKIETTSINNNLVSFTIQNHRRRRAFFGLRIAWKGKLRQMTQDLVVVFQPHWVSTSSRSVNCRYWWRL